MADTSIFVKDVYDALSKAAKKSNLDADTQKRFEEVVHSIFISFLSDEDGIGRDKLETASRRVAPTICHPTERPET